jgi:hypothetical protein
MNHIEEPICGDSQSIPRDIFAPAMIFLDDKLFASGQAVLPVPGGRRGMFLPTEPAPRHIPEGKPAILRMQSREYQVDLAGWCPSSGDLHLHFSLA